MKSLLLSTAMLLVAGQAMAIEFTDTSPQRIGMRHTNRAVAAVVRHLGAPETAKFRGLYLGTNPSQRGVVCGFVTARDSNGKLPGFQPFVYNPQSNDALFMPMADFRKKATGPIYSVLYHGAGCGALLRP